MKYASWMERRKAEAVQEELARREIKVSVAQKTVCLPLSRRIEVGIVPPDAWRKTELCKRPLSWYWVSDRAGQWLLVSSRDLTDLGVPPQIVLQKRRFRPPRLPDDETKRAMILRPSYLETKPEAWDNLDAEDPAVQERWLRVMGIRGMTYRELFLTHCANHANFIDPLFYVEEDGMRVPYSIGPTRFVCSACLEFFNILGAGFSRKLVVPCPGAVLFAGLPANRYLEVTTLEERFPKGGHE